MHRMLTNQAASETVSVTEGRKQPPPTLLLLLINCGIYRLVFPQQFRSSKHMHTHTHLWRVVEVCNNSSRLWGIIPQVMAVHDNVPCNKAQESPVASLMPQEWVAGWMVMLVESDLPHSGHDLTILLFCWDRKLSPLRPPPCDWWCVCGWSDICSENAKLHVFLAARSLFKFISVSVSLFLCLLHFSHERSASLILFLYHRCMVFPFTPCFFSLHLY